MQKAPPEAYDTANVTSLVDRIAADLALRHLADRGLLNCDSWKYVGLPKPPRWWPTRQETGWVTAATGTDGR